MSMIVDRQVWFRGARVPVPLEGSNHTIDFSRPEGSRTGVVVALRHDDKPVQTVLVELNPKGEFVWCITEPSMGSNVAHQLGQVVELMQLYVGDNSLVVTHLGVIVSQDGTFSSHYFNVDWW